MDSYHNGSLFKGGPISPYLFILSVEILAIMIRQNKNIKGIFIGEIKYKISPDVVDVGIEFHRRRGGKGINIKGPRKEVFVCKGTLKIHPIMKF